ncbi:hypothetical protein AB9F38_36760, partial [Rhizobium leguminosarum]
VVNLLQIEGEDQVTLKVTIAEVRREVLKQLCFDNLVSSSSGMTVAQLGSPSTVSTMLSETISTLMLESGMKRRRLTS